MPRSATQVCQPSSLLFALLILILTGCRPAADTATPAPPLAGVGLRLVVVGDPAIASAAEQLRAEWAAQTGAEFEVRQVAEKDFAEADDTKADAVLCPSHLLGPLAEWDLIAPLPRQITRDEAWADLFALPRTREAAWGDNLLAVPFGSPVLTCYYRADLLEKLDRKPPQTWAEYHELAQRLNDNRPADTAAGKAGWAGTVEPLGPGWAGLVLLARAAPYAKHRDNYSVLFDIVTLEPLVSGPPFVRALEELVAAAKLGPPEQLQYDPAAARAVFWQGRCGMALSWPTAALARPGADDPIETVPVARSGDRPQQGGPLRVGFAESPGSMQVYNIGGKSWEDRPEGGEPHVPLLGVAGRIGVVGGKSEHPEAALQLLLWLSGQQWGARVSAVSPATTLFRRSQVESPREWVEKPVSGPAATAYAALTEQTLQRQESVMALRLPGRAEYLAALDEAVQAAVRSHRPPAEALQQAADRWREITHRLGTDRQKRAYLHSLGLE
jgi:ABC-type glycerol-3-phosphate transport system substrate-binding protein